MNEFIGFTDVQVSSALCFTIFWGGILIGAIFTDSFGHFIKWLLTKIKKKNKI